MNRNKGDVLFLCQYFFPEYNSSAVFPWDTATYLAGKGIKVGALCGYPKEYVEDGQVPDEEQINNVLIKRLHYLSLKRGKKITRLINFSSFTFRTILRLKELSNYKSVLVYSNPPILPIAAILAHKRYGTKIMFVSYDVYPEIAVASGKISPNGIISRAMNLVNQKLFDSISKTVALSEDMRDYLLINREALSSSEVEIIPNWAHEGICNTPLSGLKQKYNIPQDAFVVSYLGNMGVCQDMETITDAVQILSNESDVYFIFAGHGVKKESLEKRMRNNPKVSLQGYLTGREFEEVLALSSCGIVSLNAGLNGKCAPSKYYSYLQSGCAVLSVMERNAYVSREVEEQNLGYAISNGDGGALAEAILAIKNDPETYKQMKENAVNLYRERYAKEIALNKYFQMVESVLTMDL